ncbi:hypothetical protein [Brevundimonas sp.]|uniref:hypothetical protein n=1 Tax=Brevundimonas sp. TaxID=1871086 RepID=UPI002D5C5938|nr:hypothetical protein [Brevundimonas sp.]HYC66637.1 hypothetical protein [Brevundimonas sp.]
MKFALYDPSTGQMKAILTCSERVADLQAREGLAVLPLPADFTGDDTTHKIIDGAPAPL